MPHFYVDQEKLIADMQAGLAWSGRYDNEFVCGYGADRAAAIQRFLDDLRPLVEAHMAEGDDYGGCPSCGLRND